MPRPRLRRDEAHVVVEESGEHPDRIRATADAGDDDLGQPFFPSRNCTRLASDHNLQLAHDLGIGMRADAEPMR